MLSFDIEPYVGALPVRFRMHRTEVHALFGIPEATHPIWDKSGTTDYWAQSRVNVAYNNDELVNHVGFCPGGFELFLLGTPIWSETQQSDPNPVLMQHEPNPVESLGFLIFPSLGISTTGYHDSDDGQRALTVSPVGAWDKYLKNAKRPDLSKYGR